MTTSTAPLRARRSEERTTWPAQAQGRVRFAAGMVSAVAALVIVGWYLHVDVLVRLSPSLTGMKMLTAVILLATSTGYVFESRALRRGLLLGALTVSAAVLLEHATGTGFGIDQLLARDWTAPAASTMPGRPAETTATSLLFLALAGLLAERGRTTLAQFALGVPTIFGLLACYGYLYGADAFYQVGPYSTMAVHAAVCVLVMTFAIWLSVPHGIIQWISFGNDTGARLQRFLIPVGLVIVPLITVVLVLGETAGIYEAKFGVALLITVVAFVITLVGYRVGRAALRLDLERDILLDELHQVNADLEDRVRMRSQQLNRQRTKLALFEERDRIARDLHDRVIQRIFAGGLQLASLSRTTRKQAAEHGMEPSVAESLDLVARELDLSIRELRNSIFELTSIGDHDDLEQVVVDLTSRASRILGFMPRVGVTGQYADVRADLIAQVSSVIQEALSNIAKHAHASSVEVALHVDDTELQLAVSDDGVGLPDPLPHSSGLTNVIERARALGGDAAWGNGSPSGTVLTWWVPLERDYGKTTPVADSETDHNAAAIASS